MPYRWTPQNAPERRLTLWPHQSLPPQGFVWFIAVTCAMLALPLVAVLGSGALWGLLPFLALAVGGAWFAIHRSRRAAAVSEVLTLTETRAHLVHRRAGRPPLEWDCNRHWARTRLHPSGGPVPNYVTLSGNGREVEIGAFLSEKERVALYDDLCRALG